MTHTDVVNEQTNNGTHLSWEKVPRQQSMRSAGNFGIFTFEGKFGIFFPYQNSKNSGHHFPALCVVETRIGQIVVIVHPLSCFSIDIFFFLMSGVENIDLLASPAPATGVGPMPKKRNHDKVHSATSASNQTEVVVRSDSPSRKRICTDKPSSECPSPIKEEHTTAAKDEHPTLTEQTHPLVGNNYSDTRKSWRSILKHLREQPADVVMEVKRVVFRGRHAVKVYATVAGSLPGARNHRIWVGWLPEHKVASFVENMPDAFIRCSNVSSLYNVKSSNNSGRSYVWMTVDLTFQLNEVSTIHIRTPTYTHMHTPPAFARTA